LGWDIFELYNFIYKFSGFFKFFKNNPIKKCIPKEIPKEKLKPFFKN